MKAFFKQTVLATVFVGMSSVVYAGNPTKRGDIIGRDLNTPGLGWVGHIGIYDGSNVLEVLNANPVIQLNSLTSFKNASSYWGARYLSSLSTTHSQSMINVGLLEKSYGAKYDIQASTGTPSYERSTCIQYGPNGVCARYSRVRIPGIWRCDSFVNYLFQQATGNTGPSPTLPRTTYNSFPSIR